MDLGIRGRTAAVAAASRGLGLACAEALAREGVRVAICSRRRERIEAAAARIRERVPDAHVMAVVADVSRRDDCIRFVEQTVEALGAVDILVTNTGGPAPGGFGAVDEDAMREGVDSTLMNVVTLVRAAVGPMRRRRWGRIVNIVSMTVRQPKPDLLVSNTLRPAIVGFAKSISFELAADGITVNNVAPGYTRTERLDELAAHVAARRGIAPEAVFAEWEATVPARRLGRPEEIGALVAFLASEPAAYLTGTTIQVDGGSTQALL